MFLLCLLAGYLLVRLWEDTTATIRGHEPPRHAYRLKKLETRAAGGRKVPSGAFGRYVTGLLDDAWDSAHHKRVLMREHRAEKLRRKVAAMIERERAKWEAEDAAKPAVTIGPAPTATTPPAGFDATAPTPATMPASTAAPTTTMTTPTGSTPAPAPPAPATPSTPITKAGPPTSTSTPARPVSPVGFNATAPQPVDPRSFRHPPQRLVPTGRLDPTRPSDTRDTVPPMSKATLDLAADLTRRIDQIPAHDLEAAWNASPDPTEQQRETVDRIHDSITAGVNWSVPTPEWKALPLQARVRVLNHLRITPGASVATTPGQEDIEALAALKTLYRGDVPIDLIDIHRAPADTSSRTRELLAQEERAGRAAAPDTPPATEEGNDDQVPDNIIPFPRPIPMPAGTPIPANPSSSTADTDTVSAPIRMELPMTNTEITGLDSAIAYAGELAQYCQTTYDQISAVLPTGDQAAASCEQAQASLAAGGVTGQPLTDVASVQEQMTGAVRNLQAALAEFESAAAAANSLQGELASHRTVQEAYAATPDAGDKAFVTAE